MALRALTQFFRATKGDEDASGDRVFSAYFLRVFNRVVLPILEDNPHSV